MDNQYYVTQKWKWYYGIMSLVFITGFLALLWGILNPAEPMNAQKICSLPIPALFSLFIAFQFIYGFFQNITLSSDGIYYRSFGYNAFIAWENTKNIGTYSRAFWHFAGIYFDKAAGELEVWFPGAYFGRSEVFIPLSLFSENWRDSELGQQIKQYAPHLFEKENKQSV